MALEIENNLHAGVRYDGNTQTILSRYGVASVTRLGTGHYRVVLEVGLGDAEDCDTCSVEPDLSELAPSPNRVINHEKVNATTFDVFTFSTGSQIADAVWSVKWFRVATG